MMCSIKQISESLRLRTFAVFVISFVLCLAFGRAHSGQIKLENLAIHFEETVFAPDSKGNISKLARWKKPIRVVISKSFYDERSRDNVNHRLKQALSLFEEFRTKFSYDIRINDNGSYNYAVVLTDNLSKSLKEKYYIKVINKIMNDNDLKNLRKYAEKNKHNACNSNKIYNENGIIFLNLTFISSLFSKIRFKRCFHRTLLRSLGMFGTAKSYHSIMGPEKNHISHRDSLLSRLDWRAINLLYQNSVRPGMTLNQVKKILPLKN
jgi:hypothetical protein